MDNAEENFRKVAPQYMHLLLEDFPVLDKLDAAAVFGNGGYESNGFTSLQEKKPAVAGSRGGWGWFQWTGSRRVEFEDYCKRNGKDVASNAANYAFLFLELRGPERAAIGALKGATKLYDKVKAFELSFERAGHKNYAARNQWSLIALEAYEAWLAAQVPDVKDEMLPGVEWDDLTGGEAVARLQDMEPSKLETAIMLAALAKAKQLGWFVEAPGYDPLARTPGITFQPMENESMNGVKSWFQSKGVLAGLGGIAALIGPIFGLDLGQTNINDAVMSINELIAAVMALVAVVGRVTAKSRISGGLTGKG